MDSVPQNKMSAKTLDRMVKLESMGYHTSHLSALEIEELLKRIEQEQPATEWRSKL
jgi:hypothetical protein